MNTSRFNRRSSALIAESSGGLTCNPASMAMRTARPVIIHTSLSESAAKPMCASSTKAATASREGMPNMLPSIALARV